MREYNLVILGSGGIGKSAITAQYVQNIFLENYDPTIEDSYRKVTTIDNRSYTLEILDTAGIEQFTAMRELYIRNAEGFILAYSVTSRASFEELQALHKQVTKIKENPNIPIVLVGNKRDLIDNREVTYEQAKALADSWGGVPFYECSAKEYINIDEIFTSLVRNLVRRDSAIGSSLHNSSIYGSIDTESHYSKHKSSRGLRMKQSFAKLRQVKSLRKLVSVASLRPPKDLRQRASQFFSGAAFVSSETTEVKENAPTSEDAHNQTMAQLTANSKLPSMQSLSLQSDIPHVDSGVNLSVRPDIPVVKSKKSKCVVM